MHVICNGGPHDGEYHIEAISNDLSGPEFPEAALDHASRHDVGSEFMIRDPHRAARTMHKYKLIEKTDELVRYQHVDVRN